MRIAIDARYIREKPSGIGTYVQALVDRLPHLAPSDQFLFWAHPLAARPLSSAGNTQEVTVRPGPNSPWPVLWPRRYSSFDVDVFHSPHNIMSPPLTITRPQVDEFVRISREGIIRSQDQLRRDGIERRLHR